MAWQKGPLPPSTYNWGGVTVVGDSGYGFYFADFKGDHCTIIGIGGSPDRDLKPEEVAYYDNCLTVPPHCPAGAGRIQ